MVSTLVDCSAKFLDRAIVASIVISLVLNLIFVAVYTRLLRIAACHTVLAGGRGRG
jgi:hypothetical protein